MHRPGAGPEPEQAGGTESQQDRNLLPAPGRVGVEKVRLRSSGSIPSPAPAGPGSTRWDQGTPEILRTTVFRPRVSHTCPDSVRRRGRTWTRVGRDRVTARYRVRSKNTRFL